MELEEEVVQWRVQHRKMDIAIPAMSHARTADSSRTSPPQDPPDARCLMPRRTVGGEAHADLLRGPDGLDSLHHLPQQAVAVLHGPAIGIRALGHR